MKSVCSSDGPGFQKSGFGSGLEYCWVERKLNKAFFFDDFKVAHAQDAAEHVPKTRFQRPGPSLSSL